MTTLLEQYQSYDATDLADKVKSGEVSADELLDAAIARTEEVNPAINAVITPLYEQAKDAIQQGLPDGPFSGVPFLLKDLHIEMEGTPLSNGAACLRNKVSPTDSELTRRYKNAGLVIFGKTNTPEFGLVGITEPKAFGPCRNPWNVNHTPGGSSGGSAAAVAAGIVPMASASDGGGSIRIPASCCGLFGLKPSRGRMPTGPYYSEFWDGASVDHIISRSVRDSAAMLDATVGPDFSTHYPVKNTSGFLKAMNDQPKPLKIGVTTHSFYGGPVSKDAIDAVTQATKLLTSLGHTVEEVNLRFDSEALMDAYLTMVLGYTAADLNQVADILESRVMNLDIEIETKTLALIGQTISAEKFIAAKRRWNQFVQTMNMYHQQYDLLLTPTIATPPMEIGELATPAVDKFAMNIVNIFGLHKWLYKTGRIQDTASAMLEKYPFTQLANLTGAPAMSVPLYWTKSGLPLGVQFMAPLGGEKTLLRLASQLEQAQPWKDKRPTI